MKLLPFVACLATSIGSIVAQDPSIEEYVPPTFDQLKEFFPSALAEGEVGNMGKAEVVVGKGQVYLNGSDTNKLLVSYGNLSGKYEGGITALDDSYDIIFRFENIGYVKDDEEIDAGELLAAMQEGEKEANDSRRRQGLSGLHTEGWAVPPAYNNETKNLEYGLRLRDDEGNVTINHTVKVLGRRGVMEVVLICPPEQLESLRPMLASTLQSFKYTSGNKYTEFKEGDKIAEYGLKGLIAGGAIFAAAKFGPKIWKFIIFLVIGVGVVLAKLKNKILGGSSS